MIDIKVIAKTYISDLKLAADAIDVGDLQKIANVLLSAYRKDKKVFILGNGGSASTSSHMAADLGKGTLRNVYNPKEKRFQIISLTDNVAAMTAFANDLSYDDMFVQQLHNLVQKGDVVIGISGSGNTPNVIKALMYAKSKGATTVGLLGYTTGGKAKDLVDYNITIQSNSYGIIEDLHLSLDHILTTCLSYMKEQLDSGKKMSKVQMNGQLKKRTKNSAKTSHVATEWTERSARR